MTASLALERTQLRREDLSWLPARFKWIRYGVAGSVWALLAGIIASAVFMTPRQMWWMLQPWSVGSLVPFGWYLGDRASRSVVRARLRRLASSSSDLRELARLADGEIVHVRGTARAKHPLVSSLKREPAIFSRVHIVVGKNLEFLHETAVDFDLVDESGETISVEVAGARLLVNDRRPRESFEPTAAMFALPLPPRVRKALARKQRRVRASETVIRDGDVLELVGYKSRVVDQAVTGLLARETPMRATLRSGRHLPLLIARADRRALPSGETAPLLPGRQPSPLA